jgi:undecaprenyl-diphosphatase
MLRWIPARRGLLLPPALRRPAAVTVAGCVAVTVLLALAFNHQARPDRLDAAVDARILAALGGHQHAMHLVAKLGTRIPVIVMTVALVVTCLAARWWRGAALAGLGLPAAVVLTEVVLKPFIDRTLQDHYSFPSGHATALFGLAAICAILLVNPPRPRLSGTVRLLLVLGAVLVAAVVAVAVVALRFHYFTDTVAGAAVGIGTVLLTALLLDRAGPRAAPWPPRPRQG